jgi:hypothetical protein
LWPIVDVDREVPVSDMQPIAGGAASDADVEQARDVLAAAATELADVRAAATKWQAGLASLAGGITVLSLVKGRDDVSGLKSPWGVWVGILLAGALLSTLVGSVLALGAANGIPISWRTSVWRRRLQEHRAAALARSLLIAAVGATVLSVLLLGTAAGVAWYAPEAKKDLSLSVVSRDGAVACGMAEQVSNAILVLKTANGPQSVKLADVVTISPVGSCPAG